MTPSVFLRIVDGRLILWNYLNHRQFEIQTAHLNRLIEISAGDSPRDSGIDSDITQSRVLDNPEPDEWGWDCLSRIFHVGTQIGRNEQENCDNENPYRGYIEYCASIVDKIPDMFPTPEGNRLTLPRPELEKLESVSLKSALWNRRTHRCFRHEALDLTTVSNALYATFGAVHGRERDDLKDLGLMPVGYRRTSPSGGGLHPSEPYLVAVRVNGLEPGIYHYSSGGHYLTAVGPAPRPGQLGKLLCAQNFAEDLSYGIFVASTFSKMWWKYPHSRAYRVALLDIGCLTQTFQLVCTAQGVQSWPTGYFNDHQINALLGLDGKTSSVIFFLGAGRGDGSVAPEALAAIHDMQSGD
ncbi:SagB/ThcOx family dehydrogenase [Paraburkholderia bryophila]|uniref:SagB/ThcOx family dehydrogenase n=1 Tax=Paraburkholderia bryophila TaxID=420952 RepID=UPI00234BD6C2|nr:SagB/ThcOx family dehydrogenase [Paraburkholderia bryophila]WCM21684.1 SagB/ThcOx family dehydrogenase [Paraburkholderia bryophila]